MERGAILPPVRGHASGGHHAPTILVITKLLNVFECSRPMLPRRSRMVFGLRADATTLSPYKRALGGEAPKPREARRDETRLQLRTPAATGLYS